MAKVTFFNDPDDMFDYLETINKDGAAAYEAMAAERRDKLVPGSHYAYPSDVGFLIFGQILEPTDEEDAECMRTTPYLRLVVAYSVGCPQGEVGTDFASKFIPIPKDLFDRACERGWDVPVKELIGWLAGRD